MLKNLFFQLIGRYSKDQYLVERLWIEIENNYSEKNRYYHNLSHLEYLVNQLLQVKDELVDWDLVLFAVFYHDIIYNACKSNNEEESAELAEERLQTIGLPQNKIKQCHSMIRATKGHVISEDKDTDYFTDADLSILGQHWEEYSAYYKNVRKEYLIYPDLLYNPGRKKVLNHFLSMERIFKTEYFYNEFESQARQNLKSEHSIL